MIIPPRDGREMTAADHLATDSIARAVERIQVLVRSAKARLDMSLSETVTNALAPLRTKLDQLEERINTDDAEK
jgi:predicted YcjX-like family ATPase